MRELANLIHMVVNHGHYFPRWSRARYARMWVGLNPYEAIRGCYDEPRS